MSKICMHICTYIHVYDTHTLTCVSKVLASNEIYLITWHLGQVTTDKTLQVKLVDRKCMEVHFILCVYVHVEIKM